MVPYKEPLGISEAQMPGAPVQYSAKAEPWPSPSTPHSPFLYNPSLMMPRAFLQPFQPSHELNSHSWITQSTTPGGGDIMVGSQLLVVPNSRGSGA